jgi:ribosomal protein S8
MNTSDYLELRRVTNSSITKHSTRNKIMTQPKTSQQKSTTLYQVGFISSLRYTKKLFQEDLYVALSSLQLIE